jgi:hypothetical protein
MWIPGVKRKGGPVLKGVGIVPCSFFPCVGDALVNPSRKYCHFLFPLNVGFLPSGFPSLDCTDVTARERSLSVTDKITAASPAWAVVRRDSVITWARP